MANVGTLKIEGMAKLQRNLAKLEDKVQRKVLLDAAKAGAEVIRDAAADNAGAVSRRLGNAVVVAKTKQTKSKIELEVGPDKSKTWWGLILEFGAGPHTIKAKQARVLSFDSAGETWFRGSVDHPGMPAHPWLTPAFESKKRAALEKVADALRDAIKEVSI